MRSCFPTLNFLVLFHVVVSMIDIGCPEREYFPDLSEDQYEKCQDLLKEGCPPESIDILNWDPIEFTCRDSMTPLLMMGGIKQEPYIDSDFCPRPDADECMMELNYEQCIDLIRSGCPESQIIRDDSCPYFFECSEGKEDVQRW
mmetsp:Transcript_3637/g.4661  ORF Transcript_3637/g.4661 Transcript_3637/m.4661 type:complete len:144 (-) Transcript_3637:398-829(-)